ncbi:Uncharacterised protein [Xylophilus ampelinus]|nr:Uncharacterised protein [Xylophilus ampelinus]
MSQKDMKPAQSAADPKALQLPRRPGEGDAEGYGRALSDPALNAACVMTPFGGYMTDGQLSVVACMDQVRQITERVKAGDLGDIEEMLVSQAAALQTMFVNLARRAQAQQAQRNMEAFLGLALKAQSASRATLSALVDLKFPRTTVIAEQANVATAGGNQQVNNGVNPERSAQAPAPGRQKSRVAKTQLLERNDGQPGSWMDTRAKSKAARGDPAVEAVGEVDGAEER